ncbi:hypothetical protein LOAG_12513 [Loa loa]|uniref:Uncharacterized protein n=1 Tax=Loa loa TaxID=7209 RepID=A0A1S0TL50_LOALO|nr:hypothetical protein LOAG_12513 [Loa loa]EFO15996.1 hypothetical protein LOAG_12513 [Loa loa]
MTGVFRICTLSVNILAFHASGLHDQIGISITVLGSSFSARLLYFCALLCSGDKSSCPKNLSREVTNCHRFLHEVLTIPTPGQEVLIASVRDLTGPQRYQ